MFDDVYVKCDLPGPDCPFRDFQTYDTPNQQLSNYVITENGRLQLEDQFSGEISDVDITGKINIYTDAAGRNDDMGRSGETWEYSIYFTNGTVEKINLVKHTPPDNS